MTNEELSKQFIERANAEREAGTIIDINHAYSYLSVTRSNGSEYYFQDQYAEDLFKEVPEWCTEEDYILATSQNWQCNMKVTLCVSALTRMEFSKDIEVPDNTTDEELNDMAEQLYEDTDSSSFTEDLDYWERGSSYFIKNDQEKFDLRITRLTEVTMKTIEELKAALEELQQENKYLTTIDELAPAQGMTRWGPRAAPTNEEREAFKQSNAKYKYEEASQESNSMLSLVTEVKNMQDKNSKLRKKRK